VIAVVVRGGDFLLVRRANPPDAGLWGFPGGKVEFGETVAGAALRELAEETAVAAEAEGIMTTLDIFERGPDGALHRHFILIAVLCRWIAGEPEAGDDALEAGWFDLDAISRAAALMSADVESIARSAMTRN
jgi:8-oxo-dGTP diphosphatase